MHSNTLCKKKKKKENNLAQNLHYINSKKIIHKDKNRLVKGGGSLGREDGLGLLDAVGKRELEATDSQLLDVLALDVLSLLKLNNLEDVDRSKSRSVAGSHILVKSVNGSSTGELTVLLVHVVGTGTRVVTDPDTEVLDLVGSLLVNLVDGDNLTSSLLNSSELGQEVPESRLGNDSVGSKDSHTVELGLRLALGRETTANNLVFIETTH